ncbi:MAG: FAD-dependent oxidoreductase [Candidatus Krumholzibacteria bacterium]|nr:FAD-dependent oxidoreductase [Candidatus Krumholzibacteria bacterium]
MDNKRVVIVGAGLTGLGAAWELSENGIPPIVIERMPRVGGMAGSIERDGYIFDLGIHGLFPSQKGNEAIVDRMRSLLGDELIPVKKRTAIFFNERYVNYPLRFNDMFRALDWDQMIRCFLDFSKTRIRRRLGHKMDEESFEGWIKSHFGGALYNIYFGPYAKKVWGVSCSRLSSSQLLRRVTTVSLWDIAKKATRRLVGLSTEGKSEYSQQPQIFYYGQRGAKVMAEKIKDVVERNGGTFLLAHDVERINLTPDNRVASVSVRDGSGAEKIIECDYLISTMSLPRLVRSFNPLLPRETLAASNELRYRAILFINLMLARPRVYEAQWVYYSDGKTLFNRINEYPNLGSPHFAPEGKTSLSIEVTCFEGDDGWNRPPEELVKQCVSDLQELDLIREEEIEGYFVTKLPNVYPLFELDTERHLARTMESLSRIGNCSTIGRQGRFMYMNMDEALLEGITECARVRNALESAH